MKIINTIILCIILSFIGSAQATYPIVDTDVSDFYNNSIIIPQPFAGDPFYGQDATYSGNQPSYTDNGDGTITDNVTCLMWEQDMGVKISYNQAISKASNSTLGGFDDWRIPTIKELYSLANFTGRCFGDNAVDMFIDTIYFNQPIGDTSIGEREIDGQTWSSTQYEGLIMNGDTAIFGYNFVDGRLKGYPKYNPQNGNLNTLYFRMVRGNTSYGINNFVDNGDGTISDSSTGLMWQQSDDGNSRNWEDALLHCENLSYAGHSDWRLPNAKELHSILDYSRSPLTTNSPAIDPLFSCTSFNNPEGKSNYGYYWTSSPLQDGPTPYSDAVYICFGEAQGKMSLPPNNIPTIYDTHGAGAQRNDPKEVGSNMYPSYFGPQGDIQYVNNYVRAVRDINSTTSIKESISVKDINIYPNPATTNLMIKLSPELVFSKIELFNLHGHLLRSFKELSYNEVEIDISNLEKGIYMLKVSTNQGNDTRKVVVN